MRADVRCLCVAVSVSADTNNERCQQIGVRRVVSTVQSQNQRKPRPQPEAISSRTKGDHRLAVRKYVHLASWTLFELVAMEPWKVHVVYGSYVRCT